MYKWNAHSQMSPDIPQELTRALEEGEESEFLKFPQVFKPRWLQIYFYFYFFLCKD